MTGIIAACPYCDKRFAMRESIGAKLLLDTLLARHIEGEHPETLEAKS